ncbi:MAG TPA: sugar phosphate isomerase/epimerase family protein [Chryseolinea sp.]|nr:sugar phosphate isomerase/epimerase family protein [Chryseolinea sp.]
MKTSRRDFIKKGAVTLLGSNVIATSLLAAKPAKQLTGLQLYSVRDEMKKDPLGTLKQLAAMGYKHVEHANYVERKFYGYAAKDFKKVLDDLGLKMPSGHAVMGKPHWDESKKEFTDLWKYTVEDAAVVGQEFVISPSLHESLRQTADDLKRYMEVFNKSGELCKKSGMKFGYHNHDFEFSVKLDGKSVYDIMLQNTDPELVIQQLDIGNLYNGGAKAIDIVRQYPGRFQSMHVKDEIKSTGNAQNDEYESTVLGKGIVNVKEVIDLGKKSGGTKHFIIEQESYQGKTPIDSVKEDLEVMRKWGY